MCSYFNACFHSTDVNFIWQFLRDSIHNAIASLVPIIKLKPNKRTPKWFNSEIRHHINIVRNLRKRANRLQADSLKQKLIIAEKALLDKLLHSRHLYESQLINECAFSNNSKIYSYISSILKFNQLPSVMHLHRQNASSDADKASLFNSFFESVYSKPHDTQCLAHYLNYTTADTVDTLNNINVTDLDVYSLLASLDTTKAQGIDGIGPNVLQSCATSLYVVIHHLFTISLWYCELPSEWKIHSIVPIFKSGDKSSVTNYRPISLLCCISKVLERLVYDKIFPFVNSKISPAQFGFLKGHSCIQQLLSFISNIVDSLSQNKQVDTVYLDFRKAFDKVPHVELVTKLKAVGISGNLLKWFVTYLSNRKQLVSINGSRSSILPVLSGVPQGSILGPLLFLIYINDLPQCISSGNVFLFADDTKCSHSITSITDSLQLQTSLTSLSVWSSKWNLHFNTSKCILMQFHRANQTIIDFNYQLRQQTISANTTHKDLGLILHRNLNWTNHYEHICSTSYRILGLLKRTFSSYSSVLVKKKLYLSLVRSQLSYGSQLWRPALIKDILKLERIQRRATKFLLGCTLDYRDRLIKLNILPLMYYFELADILFLINSLKNPTSRFNICNFVKIQDNTNTRSSDKLTFKHIFCSSCLESHFYFNRIPRLWNRLPALDMTLSQQTLKKHIQDIFWSHFIVNFSSNNPCTFHFACPCSKCVHKPA